MFDDPEFDWAYAEKEMTGGMDFTVPHSARVWDYWRGGKDNFEADREAADKFLTAFPGIAASIHQLDEFTERAVRYLATMGVRQFLDIGTGLPSRVPVHAIALAAAPECLIAYADNDSLVLSHARALLKDTRGTVTHISATLDDPDALLATAQDHGQIDFTKPVAILLMSALGHIHGAEAVTACLKEALPPSGYLAIGDLVDHPGLDTALDAYNASGAAPYHARTRAKFASLFEGLELTGPGAGPASLWQPDPTSPAVSELPAWGAVGRKMERPTMVEGTRP